MSKLEAVRTILRTWGKGSWLSRLVYPTVVPFATGIRLSRYAYYDHLGKVGATLPENDQPIDVLTISRSERLANVMGLDAGTLTAADYPDFDLLDLPFDDDTFDAVISDQVLEHVAGPPQRAVNESIRVTKPGGLVVHATVHMYHLHEEPDYWRFTQTGLELLCQGLEIVDVGGWGNKAALRWMTWGLRRIPVPHVSWHPVHRIATRNDREWTIVTWVVARLPVH